MMLSKLELFAIFHFVNNVCVSDIIFCNSIGSAFQYIFCGFYFIIFRRKSFECIYLLKKNGRVPFEHQIARIISGINDKRKVIKLNLTIVSIFN